MCLGPSVPLWPHLLLSSACPALKPHWPSFWHLNAPSSFPLQQDSRAHSVYSILQQVSQTCPGLCLSLSLFRSLQNAFPDDLIGLVLYLFITQYAVFFKYFSFSEFTLFIYFFMCLLSPHSLEHKFHAWRTTSCTSVQSVHLHPTLCDPMDCSTPDFPVSHQLQSLFKLMSIESVMSSSHLILRRPLLLLPSVFPSIRVFSNESVLHIR